MAVAAAIGVLARFVLQKYKSSLLYRGVSGEDSAAPIPASDMPVDPAARQAGEATERDAS